MDTAELAEVLRASIDPNEGRQVEEQLSQIHEKFRFAPIELQVVMQNDISIPARQAHAVYLKDYISSGWQEAKDGEPIKFIICEHDKAAIRELIVDAIVHAPDIIRDQLCVCFEIITEHDFPTRWMGVVDKIHIYLQNSDPASWMGALLCVSYLIKNYECSSENKTGPLIEAMNLLLPMMYNLIVNLQADQSAESVLIQKQILKCYFGLVKYTLNLDLLTKEVFTKWMEVFQHILSQPIPEQTLAVDENKRLELPWWKLKKWAIKILFRVFFRYGSPIYAWEKYIQFSAWYLKTFTGGILEILFSILDQYRNKMYVSPKVLQGTLLYIDFCVCHDHSWKLLKPHMFAIIQDVLFPMLSYTDSDEELWNTDPHEYIRKQFDSDEELWNTDPHEYIRKQFDMFRGIVSPVPTPVGPAQVLLKSVCGKKKHMFKRTIQLCLEVLTSENGEYCPRQRDGALHMVGFLEDVLVKKKFNRNKNASLLLQHFIYPEFHSSLGLIRARVCWVLRCLAVIRFNSEGSLLEAVNLTVGALLNDSDLPVKVEAAMAIHRLLIFQREAHGYLMPYVKEVAKELLEMFRETEIVYIGNALQKIVSCYTEQLKPMAYVIAKHLATTFSIVIETDIGKDEKSITAKGLLHTLTTVVRAMEDSPEIMAQIEKTVIWVVELILHHNIIDYYEKAMCLLRTFITKCNSEDMLKVLFMLYKTIHKDRPDTNVFVSKGSPIEEMIDMAKPIHKIIGFAPLLLQVVMQNDVRIRIRRAGAVFLKWFITSGWQKKEAEDGQPIEFSIHEQDRAAIRELIVDAIVQAPYIIKDQLCVCLKIITERDFPTASWMGALVCLYNIIENYHYHLEEEKGPLIEASNLLLPMMYNHVNLRADHSAESVLIRKQILKCYFGLVKVLRLILSQPIPEQTLAVDEDERLELPWWKVKK